MKIAICGPMAFARQMLNIQIKLQERGIVTLLPYETEKHITNKDLRKRVNGWGSLKGTKRKIEHDLIKKHYQKITESDAILVVNPDKNGIKDYIGENSFLEMGFAHVLEKQIYLLNPIPKEEKIIYQELVAMQPVILKGNLNKIPSK